MANSIFKKRPDTFDYETPRVYKCCGTMFQGWFSLEFYSFLILVSLVIIPNMLVLVIKGGLLYGYNWRFILADQIYYPMMLIVLGYFLFKAEINFYSQKWYWALPKTIILLYTMSFTWTAYRRLLFYVTMWTL